MRGGEGRRLGGLLKECDEVESKPWEAGTVFLRRVEQSNYCKAGISGVMLHQVDISAGAIGYTDVEPLRSHLHFILHALPPCVAQRYVA